MGGIGRGRKVLQEGGMGREVLPVCQESILEGRKGLGGRPGGA